MTTDPILGRPRRRIAALFFALGLAIFVLASGLLVAQALQPGKAVAQPKGSAEIFFNSAPSGAKEGVHELGLRPNLEQQFYLYVKNTGQTKITPTVELRAGDKALAVWTGKEGVEKESTVKISFVEKPPQPGEKPPDLALVAGGLKAVVLVDGKPSDEAVVHVARPDEYVEDPRLEFDGSNNRLTATIKTKPNFTGPPARVELVLRSDRFPGLVKGQKKTGSYGGWLSRTGELNLLAEDLQFRNAVDRIGLVYMTIDGYERAFTYYANLPPKGAWQLRRIDNPIIRLNTPGFAMAGAPSKVGLEMDNLPAESTAHLGLYRDPSCAVIEGELEKHSPERDARILMSPLGPNGALLFRTEVSDWLTKLQTADIFGPRTLCLQLLSKEGKVGFIDSRGPILDKEGKPLLTKSIEIGLKIDGSPPEKVAFLDFPKQLVRGSDLPVKATGVDPESGIAKVVFFTGKPQDDGKIPPTATKVEGKETNKGVYEGKLQAPTDKKGTFDVSVAFINGVGMETIKTVQIELVDAKAATGGATITGTVEFGGNRLPEQEVLLRDPQGNVKDSTKTGKDGDARGQFTFKNVVPGTYQIVAVNSALRATGQAAVQVGAEDKKLTEPIVLRR
jgi:hypothetical protein